MSEAPAKPVFVSYSWKDQACVHLLRSVLEAGGVGCTIDRNDIRGDSVEEDIPAALKKCKLLLVVLSQSSASSAWVNQEIGFSVNAGIKIVVVTIDDAAVAPGLLTRDTRSYVAFDWSAPDSTVAEFVWRIKAELNRTTAPAADELILGKRHRTQRLIELANEEQRLSEVPTKEGEPRAHVYLSGAFTIFGRPPDELLRLRGEYDPVYVDLLKAEEEAMDRLVESRCDVTMLVWPHRDYHPIFLNDMFRRLDGWLRRQRARDNFRIACVGTNVLNRHVFVKAGAVIDGYKAGAEPGFERSTVRRSKSYREVATKEIDHGYEAAPAKGLVLVRARVREMWRYACPGAKVPR